MHIVDIDEEVEYQENLMSPAEHPRWQGGQPSDRVEDTFNNRELNDLHSEIREVAASGESETGKAPKNP